jgi:zinc protease
MKGSLDSTDLRSLGLESANFQLPQAQEWVAPNGIKVLFISDHELPFVQGALMVPGGSIWEEQAELGVGAITGSLMRRGGAGSFTAEALDLELEKLGAQVSTSFGADVGTFGFSSLKSDLTAVTSIYRDVLYTPRFEEEKLNLLKLQTLEGIRRRKDDGDTIASLTFQRLAYGDTPYGKILTSKGASSITREQIQAFHKRWVISNLSRGIFVISGALNRKEAEDKIVNVLFPTNSEASSVTLPDITPPEFNREIKPEIYFIEAPFAQATVILGELGVPRYSPDHFSIKVFNRIFGMGFGTSRLYRRIRSDLGLAYSVYGGITPGFPVGVNSVQLQTKAESAGVAIKESLSVLNELREKEVDSLELENVKRGTINSFIFANESAENTLARQALFRLYGFPLNYDEVYRDEVKKVTGADLINVAKKRWHPEKLSVVVVGTKAAYDAILAIQSELPASLQGKVKVVTFDETVHF